MTEEPSFHLLFREAPYEKLGQNRIHVDLTTSSLDDQEGTVAELPALGGSHVEIAQDPDDTHVVLADPEGNELRVIEPANRFWPAAPARRAGSGSTSTSPPAPPAGVKATLDELVASGATVRDPGDACPGAIGLADVDGNPVCLVAR